MDSKNAAPSETQTSEGWSIVGLGLLYAAALVIVIAGIKAASSLVVPLFLAIFISILSAPILRLLEKFIPFPLAFGTLIAALLVIALAIPVIVGNSTKDLVSRLPEYQLRLQQLESDMFTEFDDLAIGLSRERLLELFDPRTLTNWLGAFLNGLIRTMGDAVIVLIMVAFMLTELTWFPLKLSLVSPGSAGRSPQLEQIVVNVRRYIAIKTCVSLLTGLLIGVSLWLLEVDYPVLWGFLAFVLNYIPTIGSIFAGVPPVLLVLVESGLPLALLVAVLYLVVNQLMGSVLEPRWQGRGLGLSPLVVFISLLFWGWVLGPVGMLLSAPLTMVIRIALEGFDETRWVAIMLGGKPKMVATGKQA